MWYKCCKKVKHFPTRTACLLIFILQSLSLDYFLVTNQDLSWAIWAFPDVVVIVLFILTFAFGYRYFSNEKYYLGERNKSRTTILHTWFGVISWAIYSSILATKVIFIFKEFAWKLDEDSFFDPNTLKTSIALAGLVFLLLMTTLHNAKPGTKRRRYIEELTGTVMFDILDGIDSMEILFLPEARKDFLPGIENTIIAIACLNLVLPTVPLVTLAKTNYGEEKLSQKMIIAHKVSLAFLVNLPLLITRMIVWHGMNHGISIFTLKNIIVICVVLYDLHETFEREGDEHDGIHPVTTGNGKANGSGQNQDSVDIGEQNYALEDRFNYA